MSAPQKIQVGEINDFVVGIGPNGGLGEVNFTLQFDPNVLQVRTGTDGEWTTGAGADAGAFEAEISEEGDRARIRATASRGRVRMAGASVAVLQFQAVGPGTTAVVITDVVLKDLAGSQIASSLAASPLQIAVEPVPPPRPGALRHSGAAVDPPAATSNDSD